MAIRRPKRPAKTTYPRYSQSFKNTMLQAVIKTGGIITEEIVKYGQELSKSPTFNDMTMRKWWKAHVDKNPRVRAMVNATYQKVEDARMLEVVEVKEKLANLTLEELRKMPQAQQVNYIFNRTVESLATEDGLGNPQSKNKADMLLKMAQTSRSLVNMPPDIVDLMPRLVGACNRHRLTPYRILLTLTQLLEQAALREEFDAEQ